MGRLTARGTLGFLGTRTPIGLAPAMRTSAAEKDLVVSDDE
jgi:hypothetical protein